MNEGRGGSTNGLSIVDVILTVVRVVGEAEISRWRTIIRTTAAYWVKRWARHQPTKTLVDDLEAAGWDVVLTLGARSPRVRWELQNKIQEEICLWLYGVGRGQRPRHAELAWGGSEGIADQTPGPLELLVDQLTIRRIAGALTPDQIGTWIRAAWPLNGREYRIPRTRRFRKIQSKARQALRDSRSGA